MPRRKKSRKPKLTLIEVVILLAIGGIFLSIIVPVIQKQRNQTRAERPSASVGLPQDSYPAERRSSSNTSLVFIVGFAAGVVVTLAYRKKRAEKEPHDSDSD